MRTPRHYLCILHDMKHLWKELKIVVRDYKSRLFLKRHRISDGTLKLLKVMYPHVDWRRVDFYEGLPWYTPLVAPYVTAQALPQFYSFSNYRIYIRKFDESRPQCLADIVHEGFHINQAMQYWKGYGIGFFRGLMVHYNAYFVTHGYRQNPFEVPAYDQEFRFLAICEKHGLHGISSTIYEAEMKNILKELIFTDVHFRYHGNPFAFAGSVILCLLITVARPLGDSIIFLTGLLFSLFRNKKSSV